MRLIHTYFHNATSLCTHVPRDSLIDGTSNQHYIEVRETEKIIVDTTFVTTYLSFIDSYVPRVNANTHTFKCVSFLAPIPIHHVHSFIRIVSYHHDHQYAYLYIHTHGHCSHHIMHILLSEDCVGLRVFTTRRCIGTHHALGRAAISAHNDD